MWKGGGNLLASRAHLEHPPWLPPLGTGRQQRPPAGRGTACRGGCSVHPCLVKVFFVLYLAGAHASASGPRHGGCASPPGRLRDGRQGLRARCEGEVAADGPEAIRGGARAPSLKPNLARRGQPPPVRERARADFSEATRNKKKNFKHERDDRSNSSAYLAALARP